MTRRRAIGTIGKVAVGAVVGAAVVGGGAFAYFSANPGSKAATSANNPLKILFQESNDQTNVWNYIQFLAPDQGYQAAVAELGSQGKLTRPVTATPAWNIADANIAATVNSFISQGYQAVVGGDISQVSAFLDVAKQYPNIPFQMTAYTAQPPIPSNVSGASYDLWKGTYIAGVLAGLMTKSNTVGFITAFDFFETAAGYNAYVAGVKSVNPNIKSVPYALTQTWTDYSVAAETTAGLIAKGVDVICPMGSMENGVLSQAKQSNIYAIANYDATLASEIAGGNALMTINFNTKLYWEGFIQNTLNGVLGGYQLTYGWKDKAILLSPFSSMVPSAVASKVNSVVGDLYAGNINIPEIVTGVGKFPPQS